MSYFTYYCSLNLLNDTSGYVTLNSSSSSYENLFLSDSSYRLAPGATQPIVQKAIISNNSFATYNISQNALLKLTWTVEESGDFTCAAVVQGSTEYTATGYDSGVTTGEGLTVITTFTITVSPTS